MSIATDEAINHYLYEKEDFSDRYAELVEEQRKAYTAGRTAEVTKKETEAGVKAIKHFYDFKALGVPDMIMRMSVEVALEAAREKVKE
jgi:Cu/Ag efflux protein CusF